jgi:hypothetical protein
MLSSLLVSAGPVLFLRICMVNSAKAGEEEIYIHVLYVCEQAYNLAAKLQKDPVSYITIWIGEPL